MQIGYVYSLATPDNMVFYIGSSTRPEMRAKEHRDYSRYFDEETHKFIYYNPQDFKLEIVDELRFSQRDELYELEEYWIHQFKQWGFKLKNIIYNRYPIGHKVPYDIRILLSKHFPNLKKYRSTETDKFVSALYSLIRKAKEGNL